MPEQHEQLSDTPGEGLQLALQISGVALIILGLLAGIYTFLLMMRGDDFLFFVNWSNYSFISFDRILAAVLMTAYHFVPALFCFAAAEGVGALRRIGRSEAS